MDVAGWIQVFSIIGALIVILTFYGRNVRDNTRTMAAATKANERLDEIDKREDSCPMGKQITERVDNHETRIKDIEKARIVDAERMGRIDERLNSIDNGIKEIKEALQK